MDSNIFTELYYKEKLGTAIKSICLDRGIPQKEATKILGIDQSKVSALFCGRLASFSIYRLVSFVLKLGGEVKFSESSIEIRCKIYKGYI